MRIEIEKLVYGGEGLARVDGEVILTPFVLPDEEIEVEREQKRSGASRARPAEILRPSADRVTPVCPYFERCGGCHYQHASYSAQIAAKRAILRETLARVGKLQDLPEIHTVAGEPWGYRNRIQLHFERGHVGYRMMRSTRLIPIDRCPISSPRLNECIHVLNRLVRDRRWPEFLKTAELFTNEHAVQFNVLASAKRPAQWFFDWLADEIPGFQTGALEYSGLTVSYGSFFQVNRTLIEKLVEEVTSGEAGETAVDLYAGVGLFTIPLASKFSSVTAVESGSGAARDLQANAARAGVRVDVWTGDVVDFVASLDRVPDCVIADPPRTGLGPQVTRRLAELGPQEIRIVACDPATLARDLRALVDAGYAVGRIALIDLFPQTYHLETVVRLTRV